MTKTVIKVGNALDTQLDDESVDLVITSPPYFALRSYTDYGEEMVGVGDEEHPYEYINSLMRWMFEMRRVLKPSGSIFVVIGDKYSGSGGHNNAGIGGTKKRGPWSYTKSRIVTSTVPGAGELFPWEAEVPKKSRMMLPARFANNCVDEGFILRQEIIWSKPNSIPTNAKDRGEFTHEYIFHFTIEPKYYASPDLPRYTSIWDITPSEPVRVTKKDCEALGVDQHFAPFPTEIPRRVVSGWCPDEGVVLDPFAGSGTTALVAQALGRNSISLDMSSAYVKLARWRCYVSDHEQRLMERWSKSEPHT